MRSNNPIHDLGKKIGIKNTALLEWIIFIILILTSIGLLLGGNQ